jgi:hypothetical protein
MTLTAFLLVSVFAWDARDPMPPLPNAGDVVARMIRRDNERQSALNGYTALRRYVLENPAHKRAEMVVRVTCLKNGSKEFETVSSSGWGSALKHVFPRLLEVEADASQPERREQSRIYS